jgi:hypothetical protein
MQEKLSRFPTILTNTTRAEQQHVVNCKCKRPDSFDNMIACDTFDSLFHLSCANLKSVPEESQGKNHPN